MLTAKRFLLGILLLACMVAIAATCSADTLSIPYGVSAIEEEAFAGSGVQTVVIPSSVQTIGNRAFAGCASLTDVYLPANTIEIAADSFDVSETTVFHVYMGSVNATWAKEHGYQTEYIAGSATSDSWDRVNTLIANEATGNKQVDRFYTYRLIVKMDSGYSLPDLEAFNPKEVVSLDSNRYVLQFNNGTDTGDCYEAFYAMRGQGCVYCEPDYFLSYEKDSSESNSMLMARSVSTVNRSDPMGFGAYTEYIGDDVGKITIAIIDDGVTSNLLSGNNLVSNKSYDFINNTDNAISGFGNSHGTKVANAICNAFGSTLATSKHLSIISYRIEKPSNGDISYIMMGEAILQAHLDGANLINISIAGESTYSNNQDNEYLRECIGVFGVENIIAAAGNRVVSANTHLPARYCGIKAGAAQFRSETDDTLVRASGTATGATISGFDETTSIAAAKVTAAYALLRLGSGDMSKALVDVEDGAKMPNLALIPIVPVSSITLNDGDPIENTLWVGDRLSIDFEVLPSNATNNKVNVVSENPEIVSILSNNYTSRVRINAIAPGTTRLIFASDDGNVTIPVTITVIQPVTEVIVSGYNGETLMRGQQLELTAIVNPDDASDQTVIWSSSDPNIATVQQPGIVTRDDQGRIVNKTTVTQVGEGEVVITATSNFDQTKYATVGPITVINEPMPGTVVVWAEGRITSMNIGASPVTVQMYSEVLPEGANQTVTWNVPESIASIDSTGLLTISGCEDPSGRDNVRIYAESYNGKLGYCDITVIQLPTSITISGADSVTVGETTTLTATVSPSNAANKNVRWTSSNPSVATVATDGTVEGVSAGMAMIAATSLADGSVSDTFFVNVEVLPESVTIAQPSSTIMDIDETLSLTATVSPSNATNKTLTWESDDSSVATINSNGVVTAKAPGTVTITVSTFNKKTDSIMLTVRQPYTLNFDANGGSCSTSSKTAYSGYAVGSLPTPTRTGYTFIGWFRGTGESAQVTDSTEITNSSSVTIYAHWRANTYPVTLNNQSATTAGSASVTATYDSAMPSITLPTKTGHIFKGYYTAQNGSGTQYYTAEGVSARNWNLTSPTTLYAHWLPNSYTYSIVYRSLNGTSLGTSSITKAFGTTNTVPPADFTSRGYTTPASQSIAWDATSKTITFVYTPTTVSYNTYSGNFTGSGGETYSAVIEYQNRTANSVQLRIVWSMTIIGGTKYNAYEHRFYGNCESVSIPQTTIVPYGAWANASSTPRTRTGTSAWITIPLATTNKTSLNVNVECWLFDSNGTKITATKYARLVTTWTAAIPAY